MRSMMRLCWVRRGVHWWVVWDFVFWVWSWTFLRIYRKTVGTSLRSRSKSFITIFPVYTNTGTLGWFDALFRNYTWSRCWLKEKLPFGERLQWFVGSHGRKHKILLFDPGFFFFFELFEAFWRERALDDLIYSGWPGFNLFIKFLHN